MNSPAPDGAVESSADPGNVLVLGLPVDDLTLSGAVQRVLQMVRDWRHDGRARSVATVNVDFLTNALSWRPGGSARHPELFEVLRRADLVTADGMPIVWLSRWLGKPIRERVTGADLVPALAEACAGQQFSIYFLGGRGDVAERAAALLQQRYPGLTLAGVDAPFVHTEGRQLFDEDQDRQILERINAVRPDILLIGFGNPKQELWFNRNRNRLQAGVSIGVGGTFEFIVGRVARAPLWMQQSGLEWLFRIAQEPGRLWRRYAVGLFKLLAMAVPLLAYDLLQRLRARLGLQSGEAPPTQQTAGEMFSLVLEERIDAANIAASLARWQEQSRGQGELLMDFSRVRFMDSSALGSLVRFWEGQRHQGTRIYSRGLQQSPIRPLLQLTRTLDLFSESCLDAMPAAAAEPYSSPSAVADAGAGDDIEVVRLSGRLDADRISREGSDLLSRQIRRTRCIIDLADLSFIDSSGLRLFFLLEQSMVQRNGRVILVHANERVRQLIHVTRLDDLFTLAPSMDAARQMMMRSRLTPADRKPTVSAQGAGVGNA